MYAVIATGGKQEKVKVGDRVRVERLGLEIGSEVTFVPTLLVDSGQVITSPDQLALAQVKGRVSDEVKGTKISGFTYKSKSNNSRRWGHRQKYSLVELTEIVK